MPEVMLPLSTLTPEQIKARKKSIGASDARKIMDGEWAALYDEKTGAIEPEDLSGNLAVQMGCYTEPFNIAWFVKQTEFQVCGGGSFCSAERPYMACNLDGFAVLDGAEHKDRIYPVEAKHLNAFTSMDEAIKRYYPQLQHQMYVVQASFCYLSVIFGNNKWEYDLIEYDEVFLKKYLERADAFWNCIKQAIRPEDQEPEKQKVPIYEQRKVKMTDPNWETLASQWVGNRAAAKAFKDSEAGLKSLVDDDVRTAYGAGVYISRAKNNSLTIRPLSEQKLKEFEDD